MSNIPYYKRWVAVGLLAAATLALASPALAGSRRYKGSRSSNAERVYVRDRSSNIGPVLAGVVGGFILGHAVGSSANSRTVVREEVYDYEPVYEPRYVRSAPDYRYYDPYGDDWYDSLDGCQFRSGGPQIVFVIDVGSGHRVRQLQYRHGRWNRWDGDYYATYGGGHRGYRYAQGRYRDHDHRYCRDDDHRHRKHGKRRHRDRDDD